PPGGSMASERNRNGAASPRDTTRTRVSLREGAPRTRGAPSSKFADGSAGGPGKGARSFAAITPGAGAGAGATKAASRDYVLPLLLLALVVIAVVQNLVLRVTVPLALVIAAVALFVRGSRRRSAD